MGNKISSYRDLIAWQKSFRLGLDLYQITGSFPNHERFALAVQMNRSAVSIPSNIAEGYGRESRSDYMRFLKIARGSLYELETQLLFAQELNYIDSITAARVLKDLAECGRILGGLIRSLNTHDSRFSPNA